MRLKKGLFIVCEALEGAGKSVGAAGLVSHLQQRGLDVVHTREPGGTPFAEDIRRLLLANTSEVVHPDAELLLMCASRAQHVNQLIKPALSEGKVVLSERFSDSTLCYQGYGRGIDIDKIQALGAIVHGDLVPDMTLVLDIDPEVGIARARARGGLDRIERESLEFFNRVREGYLALASQSPDRYAVIDASRTISEVAQNMAHVMDGVIERCARSND